MKIDKVEALRRLNSPSNLANRLVNEARTVGNSTPEGSVAPYNPVQSSSPQPAPDKRQSRGANVPEKQRDLIARAALLGLATQKTIGAHFGVPQQVVSNYKDGVVTPGKDGDDRKQAHGKRVEEIRDLALEKTMAALGLCDSVKLENLEVKELGRFAKDMAGVYNSLSPKDGSNVVPIQLLVYSPKLQDENRYKVIEVTDRGRD